MSSNPHSLNESLPLTGDAFIDSFAADAIKSQRETGVPASVTLAQALLESGRGRSGLSKNAKNFFGIKGDGPAGHVLMPTREVLNGRTVTVNAKFRKYNSAAESFTDHGRFFLENSRYRTALEHKDDAPRFAVEIQRAGYATDPHYSDILIRIITQFNLTRFDEIARNLAASPVTSALTPTPQPSPASAIAPSAPLDRTLRQGMRGAEVERLQDDLIALGYM